MAERLGKVLPPARVVALAAEYLLENAGFYAVFRISSGTLFVHVYIPNELPSSASIVHSETDELLPHDI